MRRSPANLASASSRKFNQKIMARNKWNQRDNKKRYCRPIALPCRWEEKLESENESPARQDVATTCLRLLADATRGCNQMQSRQPKPAQLDLGGAVCALVSPKYVDRACRAVVLSRPVNLFSSRIFFTVPTSRMHRLVTAGQPVGGQNNFT
jgi:hypothetical protein